LSDVSGRALLTGSLDEPYERAKPREVDHPDDAGEREWRRCFERGLASRSSLGPILHRSVHYTANLDRTFFALSDPTRREILELLGGGPATISQLAEPFGLTINGVKKHIGVLEEVDLVVTAKVGRTRRCQLGPAGLDDATTWIEKYRRTWQRRLDRFGSFVENQDSG
jgi:DNA-binding transcriptional ArsR family regulator